MKLSFKLGSIPVHIHASFLLTALFLGMTGRQSPDGMAIWVGVVLVGVLVHELGHALMGMAFGLKPVISMMGMGGLTSWPSGKRLSNTKSVLVSLAGPLTGMALGFAVLMLVHPEPGSIGEKIAQKWVQVNIVWGLFNLMPVMPLDGGNVMFAILQGITKGRGERPARIVSIALAGLGGLFAFQKGQPYIAVLAGLFLFQNFQALRALGSTKDDAPLREDLQKAYAALERSDANTAARHARVVVEQAADPALRTDGVRLLAFALLLGGSWGPLMQLLEAGGAELISDDELEKFERAASELGRAEEARRIGELRGKGANGGRGGPVSTPEAVKL
jgi:Zn-dependent protease